MSAKTTGTVSYSNSLLKYVLNNTAYTDLTGTDSLFVALHTASPGVGGNSSTNECGYTGYLRAETTRTDSSAWTVSSNTASPTVSITFPTSSGSPSETASFFSIGLSQVGGSNKMLVFGPIAPPISITSAGITPVLSSASIYTEI